MISETTLLVYSFPQRTVSMTKQWISLWKTATIAEFQQQKLDIAKLTSCNLIDSPVFCFNFLNWLGEARNNESQALFSYALILLSLFSLQAWECANVLSILLQLTVMSLKELELQTNLHQLLMDKKLIFFLITITRPVPTNFHTRYMISFIRFFIQSTLLIHVYLMWEATTPQGYCSGLCKITKRFDNWNGCYRQMKHEIRD